MNFLTAEWRKLLMANYAVPPEMLLPFVPPGTELDLWQGRCYVSLVGFMFLKTRLLGVSVPFHRDFEEVNLRFYVRRKVAAAGSGPTEEWRRGVVFIKEIVPKPAITWVANTVYGEKYETHRMRHHWELGPERLKIQYEWKPPGTSEWYKLAAVTTPETQPILPGSEEEFITEHYWGYAKTGERSSNEYQVAHPRWDVYPVLEHDISGDFGRLYGEEFGPVLMQPPRSIFVAEGSEIAVLHKTRLLPYFAPP